MGLFHSLFSSYERDQMRKDIRETRRPAWSPAVDAELRAWAQEADRRIKALEKRLEASENRVAKLTRQLRDAGHR